MLKYRIGFRRRKFFQNGYFILMKFKTMYFKVVLIDEFGRQAKFGLDKRKANR